MDFNFRNIVLIIAIIMLCLCLIVIGIRLYNKKYNYVWPPVVGECPDYWEDQGDFVGMINTENGSKKINKNNDTPNSEVYVKTSKCINVKGLGNNATLPSSISEMTGKNGLIAKCNWAKQSGITWDGISPDTIPGGNCERHFNPISDDGNDGATGIYLGVAIAVIAIAVCSII